MLKGGWLHGLLGLAIGSVVVLVLTNLIVVIQGGGQLGDALPRPGQVDAPLGEGEAVAFTYLSLGLLRPSQVGVLDDVCGARMVSTGLRRSDHRPVWSPRGDRLVYTSTWGGVPRLIVVSVDGSAREAINPDGIAKERVTWSPTGRSLAYLARDALTEGGGAPPSRIHIVDLERGETWVIPTDPVLDYVWDRAGDALTAIVEDSNGVSSRRFPVDGAASVPGAALDQIEPAGYVALSPDGLHVAYTRACLDAACMDPAEGLYVIDLAGGTQLQLSSLWVVAPPVWSPDSRRLALVGWDEDFSDALYVAALDGKDLRRLAALNEGDESGEILPDSPSWSPDGECLAYGSIGAAGRSAIFVIDLADGASKQIIPAAPGLFYEVTWRPRSETIGTCR